MSTGWGLFGADWSSRVSDYLIRQVAGVYNLVAMGKISSTTLSASSSLAYLPTELYEAILDQIDPTELQKVTLALRLALPRSPVPMHQLFRHARINSRHQVPKFWQRLELSKRADGDRAAANWVRSFELGTFDVDADVLYKYAHLIHE